MSANIANLESLVEFTDQDIRKKYPDVSFPETIETHNVIDLGFAVVEQAESPLTGPGETLQPGALRREGDRVFRDWEIISPSESDWAHVIANRRYIAETSGTTIEGMPIDTGRDSQGLITGAAVQAIIDPAYSLHWKTSAGFVDLTGQQVLGVASAVRAFVQDCFNRESELLDAVANASISAEMLEEGWPV